MSAEARRKPTPKQALLAHVADLHGRIPAESWTMDQVARMHAEQHHRYSTNHYHKGVNLGPDARPRGWYTGEDAVLRKGRVAR